jgi:hypothetical protein
MKKYMTIVHVPKIRVSESKFYEGINEEQIEVRECLLSFGAEYFVFQFAV